LGKDSKLKKRGQHLCQGTEGPQNKQEGGVLFKKSAGKVEGGTGATQKEPCTTKKSFAERGEDWDVKGGGIRP